MTTTLKNAPGRKSLYKNLRKSVPKIMPKIMPEIISEFMPGKKKPKMQTRSGSLSPRPSLNPSLMPSLMPSFGPSGSASSEFCPVPDSAHAPNRAPIQAPIQTPAPTHICKSCHHLFHPDDNANSHIKADTATNTAPNIASGVCPQCAHPSIFSHPELTALSVVWFDCDSFFAAVEKAKNPELHSKPVIVAGASRRSVVATCCYIARLYGVHSAMPTWKAREKCPDAVFLPPDIENYKTVKNQIQKMMQETGATLRFHSIDEGVMIFENNSTPAILHALRLGRQIRKKLGITLSFGIGPNRFLARLACQQRKPQGLYAISQSEAQAFLAPRPVSLLPGVGPKMAEKFRQDGITRISQLQNIDCETLTRHYGKYGEKLYQMARGIDRGRTDNEKPCRSVSAEKTFEYNLSRKEELHRALLSLSAKLATRMEAKNHKGRTLTIKLRDDHFVTQTRSKTLPRLFGNADHINEIAKTLFDQAWQDQPLRLLGIAISSFEEAPEQIEPGQIESGQIESGQIESGQIEPEQNAPEHISSPPSSAKASRKIELRNLESQKLELRGPAFSKRPGKKRTHALPISAGKEIAIAPPLPFLPFAEQSFRHQVKSERHLDGIAEIG